MSARVVRTAIVGGYFALALNILAMLFIHPFPGLFGVIASSLIVCCWCAESPLSQPRVLAASVLFFVSASFSALFAVLSLVQHLTPTEEFDYSIVEHLKRHAGRHIFLFFAFGFAGYAASGFGLGMYYLGVYRAISVNPPLEYVYDPESNLPHPQTYGQPARARPPAQASNSTAGRAPVPPSNSVQRTVAGQTTTQVGRPVAPTAHDNASTSAPAFQRTTTTTTAPTSAPPCTAAPGRELSPASPATAAVAEDPAVADIANSLSLNAFGDDESGALLK